ncbi:hypothetical protein NQ314_013912 [Rhamnusium bicolor]|uniref:Phospholipid/glycerol acyltransferase domain-containing protein n=1 Tax=Rhamnusium bicolor TaxID=1586634 RepID=A0AAV8X513_9CUCU|nr:hypothetical protein NQ314_013912 [Rhamnusium bicolor]
MLDLTRLSKFVKEYVVNYIDIDYSLWLTWCLAPLFITFLLPAVIALLLYLSVFLLYIYKLHWRNIKITLQIGDRWEAARKSVGALWDAHGWIWHGFSILADCMKVIPGTVQTCSNILKEGNLLAISPGGVYEAQFAHNYNLMWKKRLGFAKVALDAKVPVIPMFTENLREAFRTVSLGRRFFLKLYALFKFPLAPIYGGFPVKMTTHLGKPIPFDANLTPEQLQTKASIY